MQMSMLRKKDPSEGSDAKADAKDAIGELLEIEGKVHEKFEDYYVAALELCGAIEKGRGLGTIRERWEKVSKMRKKLSEDPEIMEEIRG